MMMWMLRKKRQRRKKKGIRIDFDWEARIDEVAAEGESGSERNSMMPRIRNKALPPQSSAQQKEQDASGVDPRCPTGRIPEAVMTKSAVEFERKRANKFLADLEKAKAENAKLLSLLHQAQSKPNP
ncbi:hypothetical protein Dimus_024584 [Dionaea muscipula]